MEIVESKIKEYQSVEDAGEIQEILRNDYEQQRQQLALQKNGKHRMLR